MIKTMKLVFGVAALIFVTTPATSAAERVLSPDGRINVEFYLDDKGTPIYTVDFLGEKIIRPSHLGFELKDDGMITDGFEVTGVEHDRFDETWKPVWGENSEIRNHYNSMIVSMEQGTGRDKVKMDVVFRVFDDGVGFRYIFPEQKKKEFVIADELTQFAMGGDYKAWWIPGDYDTQEYEYFISKLHEIPSRAANLRFDNASTTRFANTGVQTALQMKTPSGKYVNIHEAALIDYPAMHLNLDIPSMTFTSWLTPMPDSTKATVKTPFSTPWRVVMLGDKATDILASNIIYNLNEPCKLEDTSWIKPVKFMGVWWEMITGKSQWSYTDASDFDLATFDYTKAKPHGKHGANNENVRRYIDFAAANGFDQLLVEGWNVGWEDWIGKEKEFVFDFLTPYPDFDIKALNDYARSKGIKLMMHHETSGSIPNYEKYMDRAYDLMKQYGYDAVKSGYVGNILPKGNYHYNQTSVRHYLDAVKKAADKQIMVDAHEAVRPTGLARTYPNLIGNESAMGQEFQGMSTQHVTILPFTRLKGGPMDFTPGIFRMDMSSFAPGNGNRKHATIANQLALYLTMYSPLQMAADMPEHYAEKMDAFQFIKDVPVDWSESRYIDAEPGEFIIVARKDKNSDDWYAGGVANYARSYRLPLSFLTPGMKYRATIYADRNDSDGYSNPEIYQISTREVDSTMSLSGMMARGGGFAIRFEPMTK